MTEHFALLLCTLLAAIGVTIDSAEMLRSRVAIARAFRIDVTSTMVAVAPYKANSLIPVLFARNGVPIHTFRIGLAVLAVASVLTGSYGLAALIAALLFLLQVVISQRLGFGLDGADQMYTIVWAGVALSGFVPAAGLVLIAGQSLVSYLVSGIAKLYGHAWRSGVAPGQITSTLGHGGPTSSVVVGRFSSLVSTGTMAFEVGGPFLILLGPVGAIVFSAAAAGFHLSIAAVMGLNNFVWAFIAALPAVIWLASILPWA